jgi:hypothetical protein
MKTVYQNTEQHLTSLYVFIQPFYSLIFHYIIIFCNNFNINMIPVYYYKNFNNR